MISFTADPFINALPSDPSLDNIPRTVTQGIYSFVEPKTTQNPILIHLNTALLNSFTTKEIIKASPALTQLLTGNKIEKNSQPFAMNYGGHQFGHWAGQLGDGRTIHLGALKQLKKTIGLKDKPTHLWQLQLKGAGPTPYSRSGDGLAVLRSSIREYLCSEAMYALGVPTTRALSLSLSGDQVLRDILYNGNSAFEKGAIIGRIAPNFIRFGSFELPASRNQKALLENLILQTITHYFPQIKTNGKTAYVSFFEQICQKTASLIIEWQRVGFVHGVLNTDNMSILGLTIDYGPYGWLDPYNPNWTPNTTDAKESRYRFGNQSQVGLWNLYQLANALYPIIGETAPLERALDQYKIIFEKGYLSMMKEKIGLGLANSKAVNLLIKRLESLLVLTEVDMTLFFRSLAQFNPNHFLLTQAANTKHKHFGCLVEAFYHPEALTGNIEKQWANWLDDYALALLNQGEDPKVKISKMNTVNPKYVLRNYMAQLAIESAEKGDYSLIEELFTLLQNPYEEQKPLEKWYAKRPLWAKNKVGCSVLSCSS